MSEEEEEAQTTEQGDEAGGKRKARTHHRRDQNGLTHNHLKRERRQWFTEWTVPYALWDTQWHTYHQLLHLSAGWEQPWQTQPHQRQNRGPKGCQGCGQGGLSPVPLQTLMAERPKETARRDVAQELRRPGLAAWYWEAVHSEGL